MIVHRAAWVLPIAAPPIRDGWVAVDGNRIVDCGSGPAPASGRSAASAGHQPQAILPGLVNAHTHLELSYLRGRVPPSPSFDAWVRALVALRRQFPDPFAEEIVEGVRDGIAAARQCGTALVGDISNSLVSVPLLQQSALAAHVFHEVLGFNVSDPLGVVQAAIERLQEIDGRDNRVRASIAPHAPYSLAPAMFEAIARELAAQPASRTSLHLAESAEEVAFLINGGGAIKAALEQFGAWNPSWVPPACSPVEYIDRFGLLSDRLLAVHGVQLSDPDLARLAAAGTTLVTCPRSNRWVGAGDPPVARFYGSGVRIAIGTDSLASVGDLNVFAEMAAIRALAPTIPARAILESATRHGAEALGFGSDFGTIEPGKEARLLSVELRGTAKDVEEYLVGGIEPAQLRWLDGER